MVSGSAFTFASGARLCRFHGAIFRGAVSELTFVYVGMPYTEAPTDTDTGAVAVALVLAVAAVFSYVSSPPPPPLSVAHGVGSEHTVSVVRTRCRW